MTSKERMLTAMRNRRPDMVPVAPDMSNMIPCRLTGKPFWDIYLYNDPPRWKAYIDAVRHFGFDGWLDGAPVFLEPEPGEPASKEKRDTVIVLKTEEQIVTREYVEVKGRKTWSEFVTVYYRSNPPASVKAEKIGLQAPPEQFFPIEGRKKCYHPGILQEVKDYMGDSGVVGVGVFPPVLGNPESAGYSIYDYTDDYAKVKDWSLAAEDRTLKILRRILDAPVKPDFILTGGSGMLIFNTPEIVRDLTLPCLQKITKMCRDAGIPSQVHCCGPEKQIVRLCAEETDLNSINPLEIPPMGDCELKEIKRDFGRKLSLMGNLHTTEVMLRGTPEIVAAAARRAIEDAAEGGGFILSTGDQCGRDTPEENILAMMEAARMYGKY